MRKRFPSDVSDEAARLRREGREAVEDFNFTQDIEIDRDALDDEWLRQPALFLHYAELSAQANKVVAKLEERMKVLRSQIILDANENPTIVPGEKITAQSIEAFFRSNSEHRELKQKLITAQYRADMLDKAVRAFYQRKEALENLVRLHGQQYFAGPKEPRTEDPEENDVRGRVARDRIREHLRTKREEEEERRGEEGGHNDA